MKNPTFQLYSLFNLKIGQGSPKFVFILFILYVLCIELAIMLFFEYLDYGNLLVNASIDGIILISLIIPFLYLIIYKPTLNYIKEYKIMASKIAESEEKFKNAFEYSAIGMALNSLEGNWLKVNSQVLDIVGYSEEELLSMTFQDITHPDDLTTDLNFITQLLAGEIETYSLEKRYLHKQGNAVWILLAVSLVRDEAGTPLYFISQIKDITKRKIAEEELHKSQQQYRDLVDSTDGIVWEADAQTFNFTYVSKQAERLLGYSAKEWKEAGFWANHLYNEDKDDAINYCISQTKQKLSHDFEYRFVSKDGRIVWLRDIVNIVIEDEEPRWIRGVMIDITSNKETEEKIKFQNEELQKLNAEKDKFFSIIAHDLRGPISSFLGLTELLEEKQSSLKPEMQQKMVVSMKNSANSLFTLLENLLEWAKSAQGLIPFVSKNLELYTLINESVTHMQETANKKGIELFLNIPNEIVVFADRNMTKTIIRNLISNALKYTPKGGAITLSAKNTEDNKVEIAIKDTGIGMNQTLLDNLFKIDVQSNRKGTENEPSSGLGLMLCKDFVEKNGGKIWVESEENKGSVFYFTLPYQRLK